MIVMIDKPKVSGEEMSMIVKIVEDGVGVVVWKIKKEVATKMNVEDDLVRKGGGGIRGKGPSPLDAGALCIHRIIFFFIISVSF